MPPKDAGKLTAAEKALRAAEKAARLEAAMKWDPTPQTHLNFIHGFDPLVGKAKKLLMSDANIDTINPSGSSLTHAAVRSGNARMLELILSFHPKNIDAKENASVGGSTPLHLAALLGDEKMVMLLLKNGAKASSQDASLSTPVHIAARRGFENVVRALLPPPSDAKAKVAAGTVALGEMLDGQGKSAHYWAKEFGHNAIADILPPIPYDSLVQMDLSHKQHTVWNPHPKKKKSDKKDKKGKKDEKGKKKK